MDSPMGKKWSQQSKSVITGIQRSISNEKDNQDKYERLEETNERVQQPSYKSIDPDSQIATITNNKSVTDVDRNRCVFCLDGGNLIHMCECSIMAHKNCALDYIRFPGSINSQCCQCRKQLNYTIVDGDTPMKNKYILYFWSILFGYLTLIGLSIYLTLLIPRYSMNPTLYGFLVANLCILWPLIIIYIVHKCIEHRYGPKNKTDSAKSDTWFSGWGGEGCSCEGDACGICLLILCFVIILFVQISATVYIIMSLYRHYRSFTLKSKEEIEFKHEKRPLNTKANESIKSIV